jgi:hypothetical protein
LPAISGVVDGCHGLHLGESSWSGHFECTGMAHPSGIGVTVMSRDGTAASDKFDERRVGLDHLAFRIGDEDELRKWIAHFDKRASTSPESSTPDTGPP